MNVSLKRACPVCAFGEGEFLHHQEYLAPRELHAPGAVDIVACARCGVGFADFVARQEELDEAYRDHSKYADTSLYAGHEDDDEQRVQPPTDAPWDLKRLSHTAQWLSQHVPLTSRVLDAGCATGALLGYLIERGFSDLVGLDPSPVATKTVAEQYAIPTVTGSFLDPPEDLGTFDVVVLSHVLEHLADVNSAIQGLWTLTRPGGSVYIEVPDAERYADYLVAPFHDFNTEHINHFSSATLLTAMNLAGFEAVIVDKKEVLCSPTDLYPAVFGLFRRPPHPEPAKEISKDVALILSLRRYVDDSSALLTAIVDRVLAEVGDEPVVVWGAGQLSMKLLAGPLDSVTVSTVVDTSASKWGMHLGPYEVVGPDAAKGTTDPVIITSIHHQQSIRETIEAELGARRTIVLRQ